MMNKEDLVKLLQEAFEEGLIKLKVEVQDKCYGEYDYGDNREVFVTLKVGDKEYKDSDNLNP